METQEEFNLTNDDVKLMKRHQIKTESTTDHVMKNIFNQKIKKVATVIPIKNEQVNQNMNLTKYEKLKRIELVQK